MWDLSSLNSSMAPALEAWNLNHSTTREVPSSILFIYIYLFIYLSQLFLLVPSSVFFKEWKGVLRPTRLKTVDVEEWCNPALCLFL